MQQQLMKEAEVRMRAEHAVSQASQQLEALAASKDTSSKDKVWRHQEKDGDTSDIVSPPPLSLSLSLVTGVAAVAES